MGCSVRSAITMSKALAVRRFRTCCLGASARHRYLRCFLPASWRLRVSASVQAHRAVFSLPRSLWARLLAVLSAPFAQTLFPWLKLSVPGFAIVGMAAMVGGGHDL